MNLYRMPFGAPYPTFAGNGGLNAILLNQATNAAEWVFQSATTDPIVRLGYFQFTAISAPVYQISLQGVDANGNPDGVVKASTTFTPSSATDNQWSWRTLDNAYTPSRGEYLALVISYVSGTIDSSHRLGAFPYMPTNGFPAAFPYYTANVGGVRTRNIGLSVFGYQTASATFGYPLNSGTTTVTFNSTSNPNEYGAKFSFLASGNGTYKIAGLRLPFGFAAGSTVKFRLYRGGNASDTTVLQDVTLDTDYFVTTNRIAEIYFDESTLSPLNCGDTYRLSVAPQSSTSQTISIFSVPTAADMAAFAGGANFTLSTRSGGNWTDTPTQRIWIEALLDDFTPVSGKPRIDVPHITYL